MNVSIKTKAKSIYSHFSKAPVLEMVQYMVEEGVDAQLLHQLRLIDKKNHKNLLVKSYGEKVYETYERVCKVLVTYPSLDFIGMRFLIRKDKEVNFFQEYFDEKHDFDSKELNDIISLANISVSSFFEGDNRAKKIIEKIIKTEFDINLITIFLMEINGESYESYIRSIVHNNH